MAVDPIVSALDLRAASQPVWDEVDALRKRLKGAREALLDLVADADKFEEDLDGDADDRGRPIVTVHYNLRIGEASLRSLCEAVGIKPSFGETALAALTAAIESV